MLKHLQTIVGQNIKLSLNGIMLWTSLEEETLTRTSLDALTFSSAMEKLIPGELEDNSQP